MKTRIATRLTTISMVFILLPLMSIAQKAPTSIDKEFEWKGESKKEIIYIDVKKKSSNLLMSVAGAIDDGILEVNIFNPDGDKIPGFLLVSDGSNDSRVSVGYSTGDKEGTHVTTSTSSSGSNATVTTTTTTGVGSSSNVTIGSDGKGSSVEVSSSSSDTKGAKGVMNKILPNPEPGKWKVVIIAKHVTGKMNVAFDQE